MVVTTHSSNGLRKGLTLAVCSDESHPLHDSILKYLRQREHFVVRFGALKTQASVSWVEAAWEAGRAIQEAQCHEGIFFCWTGTGITLAANKLVGIRAALCPDPETAQGARLWNHANVLGLSNRTLTFPLAERILEAWFSPYSEETAQEEVLKLKKLDTHRSLRSS